MRLFERVKELFQETGTNIEEKRSLSNAIPFVRILPCMTYYGSLATREQVEAQAWTKELKYPGCAALRRGRADYPLPEEQYQDS
jgi:hypothetical protein